MCCRYVYGLFSFGSGDNWNDGKAFWCRYGDGLSACWGKLKLYIYEEGLLMQ